MTVGIIRRQPVLTHASIVCEGMLALVNSVKKGLAELRQDGGPTFRRSADDRGDDDDDVQFTGGGGAECSPGVASYATPRHRSILFVYCGQ